MDTMGTFEVSVNILLLPLLPFGKPHVERRAQLISNEPSIIVPILTAYLLPL